MSRRIERREFFKESGTIAMGLLFPGVLAIPESQPTFLLHHHHEYELPYQDKPIEILTARSVLLTRPEGLTGYESFDLSGWIGKQILPFREKLILKQDFAYPLGMENALAVHVITLEVKGLDGEPEPRVLILRLEVPFGCPPPPERGSWPTGGIIKALVRYGETGDFHHVWQKEYGRHVIGTAVDIQADIGTPVFSPFAGSVYTMAGYLDPLYGNQVLLLTREGTAVSFAHLDKFWDGSVVPGIHKEVEPGDLVGFVGETGTGATYPHLHYEVHGMSVTNAGGYQRIFDIMPKKPEPVTGMEVSPEN